MAKWTSKNIPTQRDRLVVITGTGGIGYEDAVALAHAGASIVLAGRNQQKGTTRSLPPSGHRDLSASRKRSMKARNGDGTCRLRG